MQPLGAVTTAQLLSAREPQPLMKVEIYVGAAWVNLNSLAGENYIEGASISLGGASMTPRPVEGTWNATVFNEDGLFHPQHPTSAYTTYLITGRLTRISIGSTYGGVDYYWQRVIGYMDIPKFSAPSYRATISGGDYMKRLRERELRMPNDNYWGLIWTTNSISSAGGAGIEQYNEADAMDITGEAHNVANWVPDECTFVSLIDNTGGSLRVGKMDTTSAEPLLPTVVNNNIFVPVVGTEYAFNFKYIRKGGTGASLRVLIKQLDGAHLEILAQKEEMYDLAWKDETLYFTARTVNPIQIWLEVYDGPVGTEYWFDQFSIFEFVPYWNRYYDLRAHDANEKGVHHVTLDPTTGAEDVWQGEVDEGWYYAEDAEAGPEPPAHPAGIVFFDPNKTVAIGVGNLIIYYFTQQEAEYIVASLLYKAGVPDPATGIPYVNEAAALAAIVGHAEYVDPNVQIDKVWFEPGTTCLEAIMKICERCDYRFYFDYDGTPVFRPRPTVGAVDFTFTDPKQIESSNIYQDSSEIKNRIVIKGMRQAEPVNREETMLPKLHGEDSDAISIAAYGERTLTIDNHLFQTQVAIDAICTSLLADYKDPKWYANLKIPFNPVPLVMGDTIQWEERLSPTLNITQTGVIRDIKINNFNTTYKCELP